MLVYMCVKDKGNPVITKKLEYKRELRESRFLLNASGKREERENRYADLH
jgi:hypothetical protein